MVLKKKRKTLGKKTNEPRKFQIFLICDYVTTIYYFSILRAIGHLGTTFLKVPPGPRPVAFVSLEFYRMRTTAMTRRECVGEATSENANA